MQYKSFPSEKRTYILQKPLEEFERFFQELSPTEQNRLAASLPSPQKGSFRPKYKSPLKGDGNHAALATGFSHLAITFATDLVDHRNGWAYSFHSATKAIKRSARCFLSAKSAICNRLRCKIENHCST